MNEYVKKEKVELALTADVADMSIEDYISLISKRIKALPAADIKPELPSMFDDDDIEEIRIIVKAYIEELCNAGRHKDAMETEKSLDKFIYLAKSADVKPVVRCEECRHGYDDVGGKRCTYGVCVDCIVESDFYCAYGERDNDNG